MDVVPRSRGEAPASSDAAPIQRTFLISDIRGYSTFTSQHGDATAARLAKKFADLARDAVEARGGRVIELRGDEALAVFEDTAQAVRAAVEFQLTCAEEAAADPDLPLPVGVGIDVGEAIPVEDGYRGVALNMAARLCSKASGGEVLVTTGVAEACAGMGDVSFAEHGALELKGFAAPVDVLVARPAYDTVAPALGVAGSSGEAFPPELDDLVPLVGREHEERWLRGTWRQARRGRGRVVFVSGPAGIGKTRLAAELAAQVHRSGDRVRYAGPGGAGLAVAVWAIQDAATAQRPTLVVVDDLDVLGEEAITVLDGAVERIQSRPALVVGMFRSDLGSFELSRLVARLNERGDGHVAVEPLDEGGVRGIVELYAGAEANDAPVESMARSSGGVPGLVHETVQSWARDEAKRRLEAAAQWLNAGKDKQSSGLDFANNVIGLKLGRIFGEQARVGDVDACPYRGLAPFEETDASTFYGRERLVGELAARTVGFGLLGVVGPSGSGKSSAVMAGLLPSLAAGILPGSEHWARQTMRPGAHPLDALECAMVTAGSDRRLVLVIDQFEELFTTAPEDERSAFVDRVVALAREADRAVVVATIRADYYGHCAEYPELAELLGRNHVLVGPMSADELRRAIELPARRVGLRVESALVDALVEEVAEEPGGLPLLSTALVELWQARDGGWMRMDAYERTGGVRGAVARLAEACHESLSDPERAAAKTVLLRLVGEGEGDAAVRRRVPVSEFDADPTVAAVLDRLTADRLLTRDDDQLEIAHEALIREWPRLRGWLEEDVQGRQLRGHLTQTSKQWEARGRDDAELYRGARLTATLDWSAQHARELNELEREFLEQSRQASVRDAEKQRRTNRRLRAGLVGTAIFLIVALLAGVLALAQRGHARSAARAAEAQALTSDAERLGSLARAETHLDKALLLAVAGVKLQNRPDTRSDLFSILERDPEVIGFFRPSSGSNDALAVTSDGSILATGSSNGEVRFWDAQTWRPIGEPVELDGAVMHEGMDFTPDGRMLVVGIGADTTSGVVLIDTRTREVAKSLHWSPHEVKPAVSPDGRRLAVLLRAPNPYPNKPAAMEVDLYTLPSLRRTEVLHYPRHEGGFEQAIAFAGNDRVVTSSQFPLHPPASYVGGGLPHTLVWDLRTGRLLATYSSGGFIALSKDAETLGIGTFDSIGHSVGRAVLVDLRTGRQRVATGGAGMAGTHAVAMSADGRFFVTGGEDNVLRVWDTRSARLVTTLSGHDSLIDDITFSPDGRTMYSGAADGSVIVWDLEGHRRLGRTLRWTSENLACAIQPCFSVDARGTALYTPESAVSREEIIDPRTFRPVGSFAAPDGPILFTQAVSPDGHTLATTGTKKTITLWRMPSKTAEGTIELALPGFFLAFSPDGRTLASVSSGPTPGGLLQFWDVRTRRVIKTIRITANVGYLEYSPDGRILAVPTDSSERHPLRLYDTRTYRLLPSPRTDQSVNGVSFSPDSRTAAVGLYDGHVLLWDVQRRREIGAPLRVAGGPIAGLNYAPDGHLLVVTAADYSESVWDLKTRTEVGDALPGPNDQTGLGDFLPNGNLVVLYNGNGVEWTMGTRNWIEHACSIAGRDMTRSEWHDLLPNRPYRHVCPQ